MWAFFSRRLRMWLLLAIALPLARALVHRLALAAEHRDPSTRTAKTLHQADSAVTAVLGSHRRTRQSPPYSAVTAVYRRAARKKERLESGGRPARRG